MTKDHSLEAAGKTLANVNQLFAIFKVALQETGAPFDAFMNFVLKNGVMTANMLQELVKQYHIKRLVVHADRKDNGTVTVRVDLTPPLPAIHAHLISPNGLKMEGSPEGCRHTVTLSNIKGDLYIQGKRVKLYHPRYYETGKKFTCSTVATDIAHKRAEPLPAQLKFILIAFPYLIPESWKVPTSRGETPYIAFLGARWYYDSYVAYDTIRWDYGSSDQWGDLMLREDLNLNGWHNHGGTSLSMNGTVLFPIV